MYGNEMCGEIVSYVAMTTIIWLFIVYRDEGE